MFDKSDLPACPSASAVKVIGSKWKLMILRDLMSGTKRYNELRKSISPISQKVLTENLKEMTDCGIVTRTAYAEVPPRVEYSLTKIGAQMRPIFDSLAQWGALYQKAVKNKR
ncbi:DNA-binding HxlR family transcriptional regulator [Elusimicrobium simillimum]|uniref:winged helix-turn-helix transcriptional regulator n=1 Tax=Elusimicrobium simillimum TaxID=3143438 RepID=UPI003C6FBB17